MDIPLWQSSPTTPLHQYKARVCSASMAVTSQHYLWFVVVCVAYNIIGRCRVFLRSCRVRQAIYHRSIHTSEYDLDNLDNIETQMRYCGKALVGVDRTRTYRSDRSRWGRSHTDKRMLDHADPSDLCGRRDLNRASYTNPTGLMCVQEPSRKHPI